jgi:hypothetical protein
MLSPCLPCGRLFCRIAVLRQRLFELLLDAEGVGGVRAQNSRSACRLRARQVVSVSVSPGGAGPAWRDARGDRRGADRCWMLEGSKWDAGNLQTGAPAGTFVSTRAHKLRLLRTASSRSASQQFEAFTMRASEASRPVSVALEKLGICFAKNGRWNGEAVLASLPGPRAMLILEALRRQQP